VVCHRCTGRTHVSGYDNLDWARRQVQRAELPAHEPGTVKRELPNPCSSLLRTDGTTKSSRLVRLRLKSARIRHCDRPLQRVRLKLRIASSSPVVDTRIDRGRSSAGRASRSQCEGQGFDPPRLHQSSQWVTALHRVRGIGAAVNAVLIPLLPARWHVLSSCTSGPAPGRLSPPVVARST
jgi:hypothetical protein